MIKVENVSFSYNGRDMVFENLTFEVPRGEVLAILGANGIGKTTLFRCLMGFLKFRTGEVWIDGKNLRRMRACEFWRDLSYVPQGKALVFDYSVLNMVVMGRSNNIGFGRMPKKEDYRAALGILEELNLDALADRPCSTLSAGQLQMILIARALVKNPKILIMDEPESNLDMKNQLKTLDLIDTLAHKKNYTILINTHFPAHALRCAGKTLIMGPQGYLTGDTRQALTQEHIEAYFGVRAKVLRFEDNAREFQGIVPFALTPRRGSLLRDI
jgi:iron complex transport system ATP-binding protein